MFFVHNVEPSPSDDDRNRSFAKTGSGLKLRKEFKEKVQTKHDCICCRSARSRSRRRLQGGACRYGGSAH